MVRSPSACAPSRPWRRHDEQADGSPIGSEAHPRHARAVRAGVGKPLSGVGAVAHAMIRPDGMRCQERLVELVYELLDAHDDTAHLAEELAGDERWDAHLDYLRALQRAGRALLARELPIEMHDEGRLRCD